MSTEHVIVSLQKPCVHRYNPITVTTGIADRGAGTCCTCVVNKHRCQVVSTHVCVIRRNRLFIKTRSHNRSISSVIDRGGENSHQSFHIPETGSCCTAARRHTHDHRCSPAQRRAPRDTHHGPVWFMARSHSYIVISRVKAGGAWHSPNQGAVRGSAGRQGERSGGGGGHVSSPRTPVGLFYNPLARPRAGSMAVVRPGEAPRCSVLGARRCAAGRVHWSRRAEEKAQLETDRDGPVHRGGDDQEGGASECVNNHTTEDSVN